MASDATGNKSANGELPIDGNVEKPSNRSAATQPKKAKKRSMSKGRAVNAIRVEAERLANKLKISLVAALALFARNGRMSRTHDSKTRESNFRMVPSLRRRRGIREIRFNPLFHQGQSVYVPLFTKPPPICGHDFKM